MHSNDFKTLNFLREGIVMQTDFRLRSLLGSILGLCLFMVLLSAYQAQLVLNAAWPPVFFALHEIRFALVIISGLALAIAATIVATWRVQRMAAWLLVPYVRRQVLCDS